VAKPAALVLLGAWMAGSICMSVVATENFHTVDRLLAGRANVTFAADVDRLGRPQTRDLLRYLSSELNRLYFQIWNWTQIVLGAAVLALLAAPGSPSRSVRWSRRGTIAMLAIVAVMLVWLTPEIVALGRSLDFVPRDPVPPGMSRFWILHGAYTSLEMFKLAIGIIVATMIIRSRR